MARITSKQAKEMNEAYAKVYQNLQEKLTRFNPDDYDFSKPMGGLKQADYDALSGYHKRNINRYTSKAQNEKSLSDAGGKKDGKEVEVTNLTKDGTAKKVDTQQTTEKPAAQNNNNNQNTQKPAAQNNQTTEKPASGGLKTASGNDSKLSSDSQQKVLAMKNAGNNNQSSSAPNGSGGRRTGIDGKGLMNQLRSQSGDKVQSNNQTSQGSGQPTQEPGVKTSQTVVKDGNRTTTTTRRSADSSTPEGAAAVAKEKAAFQARREARRSGNTGSGGQPPSTQGGGQPTGGQKPGLLGRLGSLAGKAVGAARSAAGNVKQGVQSAASNVKQGAQAVAGGIQKGAQAVSGALANKGPIQGRQTGAQRRAQQQAVRPAPQAQQARPAPQAQQARPAPQAQQARPVQAAPVAKPVPQAQPVAKPAPQLSGAQRAQQMAKDRIAAGRSTLTGKLKSAPKPKPKVTTWRELEGYDPMENLFDDTVQFLVSEGHAKDKSEAVSIMSESEFIDAFNQELNG